MKKHLQIVLFLSFFLLPFYSLSQSWSLMTSNTSENLIDVWGSSASDIFAVGSNGVILHYDGNVWSSLTSGTTVQLNGIWGSSGSDIFSVGGNGVILHYDGNTWSSTSSGTSEQLYGVWGSSGSDVFVVGANGTILHYDGNVWSSMTSGTSQKLNGVWGSFGSDVFAVGASGTILHYNGSTWSSMASGSTQQLNGVWGSSGSDVFVVGVNGAILHYDGNSWSSMASGASQQLNGVWGSSGSNVLAVGANGAILNYTGSTWNTMSSGTSQQLNGVWGSSSNVVFTVGNNGVVLEYKDNPTITSSTPSQNTINIAANSDISITFGQNMDQSSFDTQTTFNVDGSMTGEITAGTFSGGGTSTITFDPTDDFKPGEIISVSLTTGIKNTAGSSLAKNYTFQFTVASASAGVIFSDKKVISSNADGATFVCGGDIDGDGDVDVISASLYDDKIAWYENTDGEGNFGTQQIILNNANDPESVFVADIDGDGDLDVLSASSNDGKLAWYENIDGNGNFGAQQIISTDVDFATSVYASDIDGDGDMDALSASSNDDKIAWYENTDGNGTFGVQQIITVNADGAYSVWGADVDNDGDIDVLSASLYDHKIAWYENADGNGSFGAQKIISTSASYAISVHACNVDGDNDIDAFSASAGDDKIALYKNTNGNGSFGSQQVISTAQDQPFSVFSADFDGDGDLDIVSASNVDNIVAWYENMDGNGNFSSEQVISSSAIEVRAVSVADIDGDGDMDVLSASASGTNIVWYENQSLKINSFARQTPIKEDVKADQLVFRITFNLKASNVDIADFNINSTTTASITNINEIVASTVFDITVSGGDLNNFNGTVGVDLKAGHNIRDVRGKLMLTAEPAIDEIYNVDNIAPSAPSTLNMTDATDSGSSNSDNITNDNTPDFTGTAEANSTVEVFYGGTNSLGTTKADGSGSWTITASTIPEGSHAITAKATDVAGNTGVASSGLTIIIDRTAPLAPLIPNMTDATDSGFSNSDNITNDNTPDFTGTAEANSTVEVFYSGANSLGTTQADGSGNWSATANTIPEGTQLITAKATDAAGNIGGFSSSLTIIIDLTAPIAPSAPNMTDATDSGSSNSDNLTNDNTPDFTGTAEVNSTVEVFYGGTNSLGTAITNGSGDWVITSSTIPQGGNSIAANAVDAAGNTSPTSNALSIIIDQTAPPAPSTPDMTDETDSGSSNTDNITNDTTPNFKGTAEANSTVEVFYGGTISLGTTQSDGSGNWTIKTTTIPEGTQLITAITTDKAGNTGSASSNLSIFVDNTKPNVLTQNLTLDLSQNSNYTITPNDVDNGSTDNQAIESRKLDKTKFSCSNAGKHTVTLTVTDVAGNEGKNTAIVDALDNIKPTAKARNKTIYLDANGSASISASQIDRGSTDNCGVTSKKLSKKRFDCSNLGYNKVIFTVKDRYGNSSSAKADIFVVDNIKPTVKTKNLTVELNENGEAVLKASDIDNGSFDNCEIKSKELDRYKFDCSSVGKHTLKLTVTDKSDNVNYNTATVTVVDKLPPIVITKNVTKPLDENGKASISVSDIDNGSTDNCEVKKLYLDKTRFSCRNLGENIVTLRAVDAAGNLSVAQAIVLIKDTTPPIAVTQNITIKLDEKGQANITANEIDNGSSDNCGIKAMDIDISSFDCSNIGENKIKLTVIDESENKSFAESVVVVKDEHLPVVVTKDIIVELDENGLAQITTSDIDNGSSDNCGIQNLVLDKTEFNCTDIGENIITLTAIDKNGNQASAEAIVNVQDKVLPVVITKDIIVELDENGLAQVTASEIDNGSTDNCEIQDLFLDKTEFNCTDIGENVITLTAKDKNGNQASAEAIVTIQDKVSPVVITKDILVELDENGLTQITTSEIDNGSSDNCGIQNLVLDKTEFNCTNIGENIITLTATDKNSNQASAEAIVTIQDKVSPVVVTKDIIVELDKNGVANITTVDIDNGSTDNCTIKSLKLDKNQFTCVDIGKNEVTLTVTDINGNESSAIAKVTVEDKLKPTALAKDISLELNENGLATITASNVDNGSTDNCGIQSMNTDKRDFDSSDLGENTLSLTVKDVNGNTNTTTAIVTVVDKIAPTLTTKNINVELDKNGEAVISVSDIVEQSADNCGAIELFTDKTNFDCSDLGENEVILTAVDGSQNKTSGVAIVTVVDKTSPSPKAKNLTINLDDTGEAKITAAQIDDGSHDNCQLGKLSLDKTNFNCGDVGDNTVTLTVRDISGNTSQAKAMVTVVSNLQVEFDQTVELCSGSSTQLNAGEGYTSYWWGTGESSQFISVDKEGEYEVSLTNQYGCQGSGTIKVIEVESPIIELGEDITTTKGESLTLEAPSSYDSYLWSTGETTHSIEVVESGTYRVKVSYNNCETSDSINVTFKKPTGFWSTKKLNVKVYPNPNNGNFIISFPEGTGTDVQIRLYDASGKLHYTKQGDMTGEIFINKLSPGLYTLIIIDAEIQQSMKVVVY